MRQLTSHKVNGLNDAITIEVVDEPGDGGANHEYNILLEVGKDDVATEVSPQAFIRFQNGPINETGFNGLSNEALLAIVEDRLKGFQQGKFSCRENALALTYLQTTMMWLHKRTRDRMARSVEGTHEV